MVFPFNKIVLQPTTLCNLDCSYCYLPDRSRDLKMSPNVTVRIAETLKETDKVISVIWHSGEPLAYGHDDITKLIEPFSDLEKEGRVRHYVQTNGTLINERWCEFFMSHKIRVGVSIDGPATTNTSRVNKAGNSSFESALKGIEFLRSAKIDFSVICVISEKSLRTAAEIYTFFSELGCSRIGINIEEIEGINRRLVCDDSGVTEFWRQLFQAWKRDPKIEVREFRRAFDWMQLVCEGTTRVPKVDLLPTIGYNGDVVLLSPELYGAKSVRYKDFIVGNIFSDSLKQIIQRGQNESYVQDYFEGVKRCAETCSYFSFCGGGQASNKFYECGTTNATETVHCRNSRQRLVDALLSSL